ncbi:alpha/beta hydrolase-fold protein [Algoriphagus sp. D3-2-R+10]|uniref:alpha/beta hydrolase n=1 Tax=Algoriphagus aurantiacus TaxID=3103948 RepID=UPI002B37F0C2|nr:alpha/beta hydrolase-fold protein [Algoriphagus sp. D3-2-R+10]MEB2775336.1 alpha/beta hydrolase-fold protein [Algoriphagus sp. D3-2-R+10]
MRKLFLILLMISGVHQFTLSQTGGEIRVDSLYSTFLENDFGETTTREISVYLPPTYEEGETRYPVIYFLHGFTGTHEMSGMKEILDYAIVSKRIRPFILVIPNQLTTYGGSFYSNSEYFGDWEDFTAFDLVSYVDKKYRTIPTKESRGITGHSMGGYGAIKLAMHHPEIFNTVYAISPGALTIVREYGPNSDTFKELSTINTFEELGKTYFGSVMVAFARSWSPNPDKPPFFCDFPFEYKGNQLIVHENVLKKWYANMPVHMIDDNLENLQKLKAIKLDWGRNAGERFTIQCKMFSQRLENVGVEHFAEEYIGTHVSGIYTKEGRIPQQVLPFFDEYLEF